MAIWECDICFISMNVNDQDQHLAGRRHAERTKILTGTREALTGKSTDINLTPSNGPPESRDMSGFTSLFMLNSTPSTNHKQNSRSSASITESTRPNTHNLNLNRAETRKRGTQTSDLPATVQASHTAPLGPNAILATFPPFELTSEEIAKPLDFVTAYGCTYVLVWECKPCNRWMPLSSKPAHLLCTVHIERLLSAFTVSSLADAHQSDTAVPVFMYDISPIQPSNSISNSPRSSFPTSQQGNNTESQAVAHERKTLRMSKREPVKAYNRSDALHVLGMQMKECRTKAKPPKIRSAWEPAARFWTCPNCRKVLAAHQQAAHKCNHQGSSTEAPKPGAINLFFLSFPSFPYDAQKSPDVSFTELLTDLRKWHTWDRKSPNSWKLYRKEVKNEYQMALTDEFNLWFGTEDNIESWHALCRAVGIQPPPPTCEECRSAIRGRHVNIVDLIEWARKGERVRVQIFNTVKELSDYSFGNNKIYDKSQLGAGAVVSHLLRELRKARQSTRISTHAKK